MNPYDTFSLLDTQWQRFVSGLLIVVATLLHYDAPAAFAAGALDASFDVNGIRIITRSGNDRGQAVAIQPADGKIIIAGDTSTFGSDDDVMVVRLDSDGSLNQTTRHWDTHAASCESTMGVVCAVWRAATAAVTSGV